MSKDNILSKREREELKLIRNVILAKKQGEALERASYPKNDDEALSLGDYTVKTNMQLNLLITFEEIINKICGIGGREIKDLCLNISRASANRQGKRLEKTLETVGQLGQYLPFSNFEKPTPEIMKGYKE